MVVVALDIGGTKIQGALVTRKGDILQSLRVPTCASKGKNYIKKTIVSIIQALLLKTSKKVSAIGIALPGYVDSKGKVVFCGRRLRCLVGVALKSYIEKRVSLPVVIENDAHCFTLAEKIYGAGKSYNIVLGIIWGTGIGSGLVWSAEGKLGSIASLHNVHRSMELGHVLVHNPWTGKRVPLEQVVSGPAIIKRYHELGGKIPFPTVTDIYLSQESFVKEFMQEIFKVFAFAIATSLMLLTPDLIVLGGGVSLLPSKAYKELYGFIKKYTLATHVHHVALKRYHLSDDQGVLGAAFLAANIR